MRTLFDASAATIAAHLDAGAPFVIVSAPASIAASTLFSAMARLLGVS